ncbi:hypothetical protein Tco_1358108, partial [Tanacetum coccineum]
APANRLKIGKCNHRLSFTLKSNEPTIQVVLDALKLTPFYKSFQITANVPEIYMQEFWAIVSIYHSSLCFKMNDKSHTLNLENFRDMLQICPRLLSQKFEDPPLKEEILSFIRDLGHTGKIKVLTGVNVNHMHHPRDHLLLSSIGVYVEKLLEDLVYQVENKNSKKNNDMSKTKYKNKADEPVTPSKSKTAPASKGSRLKSLAKVAKTNKKKQPAMMQKTKGLAVLSEVALTEAEQIKLATKRSKTQFHRSHASGLGDGVDTQSKVPDKQQQKDIGIDEGAGDKPEVPDVPKYNSESDEESWTFSQDEEDADEEEDVDEEIDMNDDSDEYEFDNDGDDLTHPNLSTYKADDEEEEQEKQMIKKYDEDDLYRDVNINLERSDAEMTDAEANKDTEDAHVQAQVSKIMPKIKKYVTESLGAEVLVRSTNQPQTSYAKNLYNTLVESYNSNKDIISSYGDVVTLKKGCDDQDKDEDPSDESNRGSKRRRSGKEVELSKELTHKESKSTGSSKGATKSQPKSLSKSAHAEEHGQKVDDLEDQSHQEFNTGNDDETYV